MSAHASVAEPGVAVGPDEARVLEAGAERSARARRAAAAALAAQACRFGLVGATNTALTLGAYALLVLAGVPGPVAGALGWALGAVNGYRLNRGWTFRSALRGITPAARYVTVQALGAGLNAFGIWLVVGHGHLPRFEGEIAILPAVTLLTFALCRGWVFA